MDQNNVTDAMDALSKKYVAEQEKRRKVDPHGFHDMSERELVDWMGAGHAQVGSVVFTHAESVLKMKQRQAERDAWGHRRTIESMDEFVEGLKSSFAADPTPSADALNSQHVAILALAATVGTGTALATQTPAAGLAGAALTIGALAFGPVRRCLVGLLNRVVG